ncbi:MAG TPA: dihydropteroate synthase [Candidatus Sulfotelmatobacter sp.]|nr:dihydropteroate synthase [Candidatus Sulfotelmatobacter sp.]
MNVRIMGIVNITADSFSDGGRYLEAPAAIAHARNLLADGADIVDLGPQSSHPDAARLGAAEEIRRLAPVIDALADRKAAISVDSFLGETQRFALAQGVGYLNDIQGFADPGLYPALAAADCRLVVMHAVQQGGPATRVDIPVGEILERVLAFFAGRIAVLERAGVARQRLILDPGMGFFLGSRPEASLRVLANLQRLQAAFELPLLVSVSRKSFLRAVTGRPLEAIGAATLAAELHAVAAGAAYIRTHDVAALRDAMRITAAVRAEAPSDG